MQYAKAVALAIAASACGSPATAPAVDAPPPVVFTDGMAMPPGFEIEGMWTGGPGDSFDVALQLDGSALDWDIHTHDSGGTQTLVYQLGVSAGAYILVPDHQTTWYLLLRNHDAVTRTLQLRVETTGGTEFAWM